MKRADGFHYLEDYTPPAYLTPKAFIEFDLDKKNTLVTSTYDVTKNAEGPLFLNGKEMELVSVEIDGVTLTGKDFVVTDEGLTINSVPNKKEFNLKISNKINPEKNTALDGLYVSGDILCTQNEPEGFRRITYSIDRPDNMMSIRVRLKGNKSDFPFMLANGNLVDSGVDGEAHWCDWEDPFPKPCYLFAIVAGELEEVVDTYTTGTGRKIDIKFYCDPGNGSKCLFAIESLKKSMKWDEVRFGLEYDLDLYMVVAVDSFNMGAMENKGLNIFNSALVLANKDTATDLDFHRIESVIGHEYFHNWSGNRVTLKNWFQLTLKEGLTVFRDQEFSADLNDRAVERIDMVKSLKGRQFPEDAGPLSHPIRPEKYKEMNNFYTATVYEKGAEIIRMLFVILGKERFRKAMDVYFKRFDGQAITTEDFFAVVCEEEPSLKDTFFKSWYSEKGTPKVEITEGHDEAKEELNINVKIQSHPDVEGFAMPIKSSFYDDLGTKIKTDFENDVMMFDGKEQDFKVKGLKGGYTSSYFEGFSSPVIYNINAQKRNLYNNIKFEDDNFNRYFSLKKLTKNQVFEEKNDQYLDCFIDILKEEKTTVLMKSLLLEAPSFEDLIEGMDTFNPQTVLLKKDSFMSHVGNSLGSEFLNYLDSVKNEKFEYSLTQKGNRALNSCLVNYLLYSSDFREEGEKYLEDKYFSSDNMTDAFSSFLLAQAHQVGKAEEISADFFEKNSGNILTTQKWVQGRLAVPALGLVKSRIDEIESSAFYDSKVPNFVRSVWGVFARNHYVFHSPNGEGYSLLLSAIKKIDKINPQMASALMKSFQVGAVLDQESKSQMSNLVKTFADGENFSHNLKETYNSVKDSL